MTLPKTFPSKRKKYYSVRQWTFKSWRPGDGVEQTWDWHLLPAWFYSSEPTSFRAAKKIAKQFKRRYWKEFQKQPPPLLIMKVETSETVTSLVIL